jgi:hypothetical protein
MRKARKLVQNKRKCCAGKLCEGTLPVITSHNRCIACLYCVHGTCHIPVTLPPDLKGTTQISACFEGICLRCIDQHKLTVHDKRDAAKRRVAGNFPTVRKWIERILKKDFPKVEIVDGQDGNDFGATHPGTEKQDVEMEDTQPPTETQDEEMADASEES